jgi:predicted MFS family arabinose efflux permease
MSVPQTALAWKPTRLRFQLAAFSITRSVINTSYRMVYPFLPAIARGIGVSLGTAALAVTARSSLGLLGPVLGSLVDQRGRRTSMHVGLVLVAAGMLLVAAWPTLLGLVAGLLLAACGKLVFDSAMYAYVGDRVPYAQRGLAVAVAEFGWSGAFLVGIPIAGWLIQRSGWSTPFPWIALTAVGCALLLRRLLPKDAAEPGAPRATLRSGLRAILARPPAVAGLCVGLMAGAANESVTIVFGAWMEADFGLPIASIGAASAVIGLAELGGEGLVAGLVDRLGKKRSVALGSVLSAAASLSLPALGTSIPGALLGLFLFFITFEFTLVATIPLMTELVPSSRATLMAANMAAHSGGRTLGTLIGPLLFASGVWANGLAAALLHGAALALLLVFVHEGPPSRLR